jgi:hypothetical protein
MIENIACMPVPKLGKKYFRNLNQLSFNEKDLRISQTALLKLAINSSEKKMQSIRYHRENVVKNFNFLLPFS